MCSTINSFACLSAYQFKIFPVGVADDKIVTVDFQIYRGDEMGENDELRVRWFVRAYVSTYKQNQKLIEAIPFDSIIVKSDDYLENLKEIYDTAFAKIQTDFQSIELFTPIYISFCNFQTKCKLIEVEGDKATYNKKKYPLSIINDSLYYGFNGRFEFYDELFYDGGFGVSSYRIYETKTTKLIVFHLATGDGEDYFYDRRRKKSTKEHKPDFKFTDIKNTVYEEPLLHHGYGFDVFFVEQL